MNLDDVVTKLREMSAQLICPKDDFFDPLADEIERLRKQALAEGSRLQAQRCARALFNELVALQARYCDSLGIDQSTNGVALLMELDHQWLADSFPDDTDLAGGE